MEDLNNYREKEKKAITIRSTVETDDLKNMISFHID